MKVELNYLWTTPEGSVHLWSTLFDSEGYFLAQKVFVFEKTTREMRNERRKRLR